MEGMQFLDIADINNRLLRLTNGTGYDFIQRNGQRHYGPPINWNGPRPERGSEIFVGRLPRDCFEDEIIPLFETVAPIYESRLMMNFTGFNRGFCFITYFNSKDAWKAVLMLNDFEIRPGHRIGVSKSIDNCRLYIGNIPPEKTREEALEELLKVPLVVKDIIMYPSLDDPTKNRGFMFIEFDSHRSAAMAKRQLTPGLLHLWGLRCIVDWAEPEPDVNPTIMNTVTKLFVRNLRGGTTVERLRDVIASVACLESVEKIYVGGYYAFIHFTTRVHAQLAKEKLSDLFVDGNKLEVQWARPRCFRNQSSQHYCRSVPPRFRKTSNNNDKPCRNRENAAGN